MRYFNLSWLFVVFLIGCDPTSTGGRSSSNPRPPSGGPDVDQGPPAGKEGNPEDPLAPKSADLENLDDLFDRYYELRLKIRNNFDERVRVRDQINFRKAFLRRPANHGCLKDKKLSDLTIALEGERLPPRLILNLNGGKPIEAPVSSENTEDAPTEAESIPFEVVLDAQSSVLSNWDEVNRSYITSGSQLLFEGAEAKTVGDLDRIRITMKHWNYFLQSYQKNKGGILRSFGHIFSASNNEVHVDVASEDSRFLLTKVTLFLDGKPIYVRSGLAHRFESDQGDVPAGFTRGLIWEDLNIRANSTWAQALRTVRCD